MGRSVVCEMKNRGKNGRGASQIRRLTALAGLTLVGAAIAQPAMAQPAMASPPRGTPTPLTPPVLPTAIPQTAPSGPQQYQTAGVIFTAPPGFSALQPLGGETAGIVYPAAAAQSRHVSVRIADLSALRQGVAALPPTDLAEYARFNFFGITNPPRQKQTRRFLGQPVSGDVLMQSNPAGGMSYIEFYLVPLSAKHQIAIAFETDTELPISLFEQTVQTVTDSLQEIPRKKKRR
jgi:hypothetical protein